MLKDFQNRISYCERCSSTLYWDSQGLPSILKQGNTELNDCLERGCSLIYFKVPEDCCAPGEMELLRLALIQTGLSVEAADIAVASIGFQHTGLAA